PGELGSSRSNRYRHDRVPHARAARGAGEAGADAPLRNAGGGCTAGGIPALRREQLHHRGGDRHRRRFICLAPTGWAATRNSAVCALTGHSGRPSGPIDRYVISAQWRVARRSHRPSIPPTIPMSQGVLPPRPSLKSAGLFRPAMEPSMPFDSQQLANFRLARGSHKQPNKGGNICVNEAAVIAAGFQYREIRDVSCLPDCFSRPVSEYAIYLNDFMMHRVRNELLVPFITRLPGTSDAPWSRRSAPG